MIHLKYNIYKNKLNKMKIVKGDMIILAQEGQFEVIGHGCNCFCRMKRGIAPQMHKAFKSNNPEIFHLENPFYSGDHTKLGNIEAKRIDNVIAVNMYTQYHWSEPGPYGIPFDYDAFTLCLRKMNHKFKGKKIALPGLIGAGLAQGDALKICDIIVNEMKDCNTSIVFLDESKIPTFLK